jgi:hypothetical protein
MPKVLFFSDPSNGRPGLGATIRLDSGEPCVMSIAPGWVRVKKSRTGLFGPTLYNVRDVHKTAETAKALTFLFPDSLLPPGFTDPVLSAFANAILHCATCGEVAIILNGAIEEADSKIVSAFADFCEKTTTKMDAFYDASVLPYPREAIISAMEREIVRSPLKAYVDWSQNAAIFMWNFLEGIGPEPIPFNPSQLAASHALKGNTPADHDELRILASPEYRRDEERFSHLWAVADAENKKVEERIAAAVRVRNAQLAGLSQTEKMALDAFADQGSAKAQFEIGTMYARGRVVPEDYGEAAKWYRRAADQGHIKAQSLLGLLHEFGQGVPQDDAEAASLYHKAAHKGEATAQSRLALMYARGKGVQKDYAAAARWCRMAAEQGDVGSQLQLGLTYASGEGVQKDNVEAYRWLSLTASRAKTENGREASSFRDDLASEMTATQIAKAQKLVREWHKK